MRVRDKQMKIGGTARQNLYRDFTVHITRYSRKINCTTNLMLSNSVPIEITVNIVVKLLY